MDRLDNEALLFGQLFVLHQHLSRMADTALEPLGVTGKQWLLLALLTRAFDEPPTLSEAANVYGTSRQNIKQIALQLQKRGFIEVKEDRGDKRALRLHLSPKIHAFDEPEQTRTQNELLRQTFASLDDHELNTFRELMGKLLDSHTGKHPR
ncbi:MarR family transcriptional regulator [Actinomycetaceae bacterium L2_0104]